MIARNCPECGQLFYGRSDKKFCGDYCRNYFNNKQNSDATNYIRNLNNILRKNRRILAELFLNKQTKVKMQKLTCDGFNFNYFTHISVKPNSKVIYYCYDYGYLPVRNNDVLIKIDNSSMHSP